jgi:hypothetical protein
MSSLYKMENFTHLVNALGMNYHPAKPNIILVASGYHLGRHTAADIP